MSECTARHRAPVSGTMDEKGGEIDVVVHGSDSAVQNGSPGDPDSPLTPADAGGEAAMEDCSDAGAAPRRDSRGSQASGREHSDDDVVVSDGDAAVGAEAAGIREGVDAAEDEHRGPAAAAGGGGGGAGARRASEGSTDSIASAGSAHGASGAAFPRGWRSQALYARVKDVRDREELHRVMIQLGNAAPHLTPEAAARAKRNVTHAMMSHRMTQHGRKLWEALETKMVFAGLMRQLNERRGDVGGGGDAPLSAAVAAHVAANPPATKGAKAPPFPEWTSMSEEQLEDRIADLMERMLRRSFRSGPLVWWLNAKELRDRSEEKHYLLVCVIWFLLCFVLFVLSFLLPDLLDGDLEEHNTPAGFLGEVLPVVFGHLWVLALSDIARLLSHTGEVMDCVNLCLVLAFNAFWSALRGADLHGRESAWLSIAGAAVMVFAGGLVVYAVSRVQFVWLGKIVQQWTAEDAAVDALQFWHNREETSRPFVHVPHPLFMLTPEQWIQYTRQSVYNGRGTWVPLPLAIGASLADDKALFLAIRRAGDDAPSIYSARRLLLTSKAVSTWFNTRRAWSGFVLFVCFFGGFLRAIAFDVGLTDMKEDTRRIMSAFGALVSVLGASLFFQDVFVHALEAAEIVEKWSMDTMTERATSLIRMHVNRMPGFVAAWVWNASWITIYGANLAVQPNEEREAVDSTPDVAYGVVGVLLYLLALCCCMPICCAPAVVNKVRQGVPLISERVHTAGHVGHARATLVAKRSESMRSLGDAAEAATALSRLDSADPYLAEHEPQPLFSLEGFRILIAGTLFDSPFSADSTDRTYDRVMLRFDRGPRWFPAPPAHQDDIPQVNELIVPVFFTTLAVNFVFFVIGLVFVPKLGADRATWILVGVIGLLQLIGSLVAPALGVRYFSELRR